MKRVQGIIPAGGSGGFPPEEIFAPSEGRVIRRERCRISPAGGLGVSLNTLVSPKNVGSRG